MIMGRMFRGLLLALLLLPAAASAALFSGMYVFGDSLSDNGNLYNYVGVPVAPYYDGRFSNGPVAAERIADAVIAGGSNGAGFHDYAWGGATSGVGNYGDGGTPTTPGTLLGPFSPLPGLLTELDGFTTGLGGGMADANALYMVWAGANDFVAGSTDYTLAVNNVKYTVQTLAAAGAQHILVPNLPDLALTPSYPGSSSAHDFTLGFNSLLASTLASLNSSLGAHIVGFDTYSLFNQVLANPSAFGFTNVSDACYTGSYIFGGGTECANPSDYLFWDDFHPTAAAHQILADQMVAAVVPEPATVLLMVAGLGFIGLQVRRARA
jgi:phospholipase/lecithinase/hemolysin